MRCHSHLLPSGISLDAISAPWLHTTTLWIVLSTSAIEDFPILELAVADWRAQLATLEDGLDALGATAEVVAARRGPVCNALISLNLVAEAPSQVTEATALALRLLQSTPFTTRPARFAPALEQLRQLRPMRRSPQTQALVRCQAMLQPQPVAAPAPADYSQFQQQWNDLVRHGSINALVTGPLDAAALLAALQAACTELPALDLHLPLLPLTAVPTAPGTQTLAITAPGAEQIVLGLHSPVTMADRRFAAFKAALGLWAAHPGSRLIQELRVQHQLLYQIQVHHDLWTGDVLLALPVAAAHQNSTSELALQELAKLAASQISPDEAARSRQLLLREVTLQWEHPRRLLDYVLSLRVAGGQPDQHPYFAAMHQVTAAAMAEAIALLRPAACVFVRNP